MRLSKRERVYLLTFPVLGVMLAAGLSAGAAEQPSGALPDAIPDMSGKILTVTGPIDPSQLGPTLMHEHIFIYFTGVAPKDGLLYRDTRKPDSRITAATDLGAYHEPVSFKNLWRRLTPEHLTSYDNWTLTDLDLAIEEVLHFKRWGGNSIVDVTSIGLGRDPKALRRVANATGLNIVMGAGYYIKELHPLDMDERTVEELAQGMIRDVTLGAQGTSIRSGIIGEIGVGGKPLSANEMKSTRASARAGRATGAPILFHAGGRGEEKFTVLDAVASEGLDLNRVIMGHAPYSNLPLVRRLLERGVYLEFDGLGEVRSPLGQSEAQRVETIVQLIRDGWAHRILLAHDVCQKQMLKAYGGMGYSYVMEFILPELKRQGVTDDQIEKIMVENPRRVLTFAPPAPLQGRETIR